MKLYSTIFLKAYVLSNFAVMTLARGGDIDVFALPEKVHAKTGESINIFIQVSNKSEKPVIMPSGASDSLGRVVPDVCGVKIRVFRRIGIFAEETERALDSTAVDDSRKERRLNPDETVVYLVKVRPFQMDTLGSDCVVTIDLGGALPGKIQVNLQREDTRTDASKNPKDAGGM